MHACIHKRVYVTKEYALAKVPPASHFVCPSFPFCLSIFLFVDVGCPTIHVHFGKSMDKPSQFSETLPLLSLFEILEVLVVICKFSLPPLFSSCFLSKFKVSVLIYFFYEHDCFMDARSDNEEAVDQLYDNLWLGSFYLCNLDLNLLTFFIVIQVVDVESAKLLHAFSPCRREHDEQLPPTEPPITKLFISSDGQWLAAINCFGDIYIFNLEIRRCELAY